MRRRITLLCSLALLPIFGCESRVPKEELGTVVFEVPSVPGAEKPPPLPGLEGVLDSQETPPGEPAKSPADKQD